MGGPKKPALIRKLEGNRSRTKIPREIEPEGKPRLPEHLSEAEQARWQDVVRSLPDGLLTRADESVLERFAVAWATFREAHAGIRVSGLLIRRDGEAVRNPLLMIRRQAAEEMNLAGFQLGLSPQARTRITALPEVDDDPLAVLLGQTGKAWGDGQKLDS